MSEEEKRVIGRGVERTIRRYLVEVGGEECKELAVSLLEVYAYSGQRGLKEFLEKLVKGVGSGAAEESGG